MSQVILNRLIPLWDCLAKAAQGPGCTTSEDVKSFRDRARSEGLPYLTDGLAGLGKILIDGLRNGHVDKRLILASRHRRAKDSTLPLFLYSAWSKVFTDTGLARGSQWELNGTPVAVFERKGDPDKVYLCFLNGIQGPSDLVDRYYSYTDVDGKAVCEVSYDELVSQEWDFSFKLVHWEPSYEATVAVRWLRQLTAVFSKLRLPHSTDRVQGVFDRFAANEEYLASINGRLTRSQYANETRFPYLGETNQRLTDVLLNARRLVHKVLCNVDPRNIIPRHGSGASACRTRPWERYSRILFDPEINVIWPYLEYTVSGKEHCSQILSSDFITDGYPKTARGVFVPKDYRGPRLISCEPATSMYYQQGLMNLLVSHLEASSITSGFVNFTDQCKNQELAYIGSCERELATLDLKDASDRLSWELVLLLWPEHWVRALRAVRSKVTEIDVPGKGTIKVPLRKHAPMGSAVCFPVMALTIWALIKAARLSGKRTQVWIYGDDIIVASKEAESVCDLLESVGLAVNRDKSFYGATPFRESCGKEYLDGRDVTPIYCRYNPDNDDTEIASLCSFTNNFVLSRGTLESASLVELVHSMTSAPVIGIDDMERYKINAQRELDIWLTPFRGHILEPERFGWGQEDPVPHVLFGPQYMCMRDQLRTKWHKGLQRPLYRIRRPHPVMLPVTPESWGWVLRSSLIGGDLGREPSVALAKRVVYRYSWMALGF